MKLPLATGFLSAAIFVGCGAPSAGASGRFLFRVDRAFDRRVQPAAPGDTLPGDHYEDASPVDRWDVTIEAGTIVVREIASDGGVGWERRIEGREAPLRAVKGERRFDLGTGALGESGRFVVRGAEAELTIYGSGVPVVMSERGRLIAHPRSL